VKLSGNNSYATSRNDQVGALGGQAPWSHDAQQEGQRPSYRHDDHLKRVPGMLPGGVVAQTRKTNAHV
jgi:hypothetical protein